MLRNRDEFKYLGPILECRLYWQSRFRQYGFSTIHAKCELAAALQSPSELFAL